MKNCVLNSIQMKYEADIDSIDTLKKVVKRLPAYLQTKWAETSSKLIKDEKEPRFSYLANFVEDKASVANTTFGRLVGSKPDSAARDNKPKATGAGASPLTKVTSLATTTNSPSKNRPSCTYYKLDHHELERCFKFRDKYCEERKNFIRKEKLCHNCLLVNHQARRCKRARACLFSGCTEQHHSLVHSPTPRDDPSDIPERNETGDRPGQSTGAGSEGHCAAIGSDRPRVSLRIVPVRVSGVEGGREVETYAFLDDGSDTTLSLNGLVEELGLSGTPINYTLTTVNAESETRLGREVQLNVKALKTNSGIRLDRVWTVDRLPISQRSIPSTEDVKKW